MRRKNPFSSCSNFYTGKEHGAERAVNQGENVLLQLVSQFVNSGRTICADNFFTTYNGCIRLMRSGLSYVGTCRSNKRYIPEEFKKNKNRHPCSSVFGFNEANVAIVSYVPKKNRNVILMSTVHYDSNIPALLRNGKENEARKPEAILFYNEHKSGVDSMDQKLARYSSKRRTNRWPLAFFTIWLT